MISIARGGLSASVALLKLVLYNWVKDSAGGKSRIQKGH